MQDGIKSIYFTRINDAKDLPYEKLAIPTNERLLLGEEVSDTKCILHIVFRMVYRAPYLVALFNIERLVN